MKIHHLQHVPFEDLGSIAPVLKAKGHQLSSTHLYKNHPLPDVGGFDWLIVMGGPMSIYDHQAYPWLTPEKKLITDAIDSGKIVLGICLGAQLIAEALGAEVYKNEHREIGWFPVNQSPEAHGTIFSTAMPQQLEAFHWHGDTFDIPKAAIPVGESEACKNQGFIMDNRVIAIQFHLETTRQSARKLIANCRDELDGSRYVQSESEILAVNQRFSTINRVMVSVLEALEGRMSA